VWASISSRHKFFSTNSWPMTLGHEGLATDFWRTLYDSIWTRDVYWSIWRRLWIIFVNAQRFRGERSSATPLL